MPRSAAVLALLTLLATNAAAQAEQRNIRGSDIAIYNLAGRLRAVAGTGDAVTVEITRGGADASKLRIETGAIRGRETLRVIYPGDRVVYGGNMGRSRSSVYVRDDGTFSDGNWRDGSDHERVEIRGYGPGLEAHADLIVRVPKGQKIALFLAVGRVEVTNVEGDVLVDVSSADVDVAGVKGPLTLDTGSGRVAVRDVTGDLNIDTGSGGLSVERVKGGVLRLDSGSGGIQATDVEVGEFTADVGSGGLRVHRLRAPQVRAETGSGGVTLELLGDVQSLDVETGSGGVTIRAPATLSADVNVETGSGGFQTDFEITTRRVGRNHVEGRIGDGKGRVTVEAGSGTVRLLKT
jgi:lia operon protein LiaG